MENKDYEIIWDSLRMAGVYLIDLHTGLAKTAHTLEDNTQPEESVWDQLLEDRVNKHLHPRFKEKMLKMYSLKYLREAADRGEKQIRMFCQRILDENNHYIPATVTAYFHQDNTKDKYAVFVLKDMKKFAHQEIQQTQSDKRIAELIKFRYDVMTRVHLDSGMCERIYLTEEESSKVHMGNYEYYIQKAINEVVYEEDIDTFYNVFSMENLCRMAEDERDVPQVFCQYRVKTPSSIKWVEGQIFFIRQNGTTTVNILGRDITETKLKEQAYKIEKIEKNHIISSLSNMFFATYYIDLENDTFRMVTQINEVGNTLGTVKNYNEAIGVYLQHYIHPDDREEYLEKLNRDSLLKNLSPEHSFVNMEYHRIKKSDQVIQDDGWVLATVILSEMKNGVPSKVLYVAQDITESKEKEAKQRAVLKEACDAANYANEAKSEFLSRVSHDIRTPLNAIIGMTTIAEAHLDERKRISDCLDKIAVSSKHLLSLINEVLDMSKIESGKIELAEEKFNLSELIDNIHTIIQPSLTKKQHNLEINIIKLEHDKVIGDILRLQQVFMNILGNAVKYTPDGGRLALSVREKSYHKNGYGCYEFAFEDNGIGMSEEFLKKIFDPFSRAEDTRINKIEGTGLGMAIALNIVHMMNGGIQIESKINEGSRFTVTVFLKQQNARILNADNQKPDKKDSTGQEIKPSGDQDPEDSNTSQEAVFFAGKRILLVDDIEINREIAMEIIGSTGVIVECAEDGKQALDKFREMGEGYYDLIFMDVQMPVMNGYEATKAIRASDCADAAKIPIIAMTANAFTEDVIESKKAGMNEHIAKPLNIEQLMNCMKRWMGKKAFF